MARILLVGGGCRGRMLACELAAEGHVLRITTRSEARRAAIEASGAECWVGTPARLETLRGALENVTIVCWLLGGARGSQAELTELHTTRLRSFLTQLIDTTARGFLYEAAGGSTPAAALAASEQAVRAAAQRNAIPVAFLRAPSADVHGWVREAHVAIGRLLDRG